MSGPGAMPMASLALADNPRGAGLFAICILLMVIATLAVGMRLWARKYKGTDFAADDYVTIFALVWPALSCTVLVNALRSLCLAMEYQNVLLSSWVDEVFTQTHYHRNSLRSISGHYSPLKYPGPCQHQLSKFPYCYSMQESFQPRTLKSSST